MDLRIPRTSRQPCGPLDEVVLGRGDYAAGGAVSLPFLALDGARRRRPLVFGEVTDDLSDYPELAAGMFSGRQADIGEWAVMWREIGADGIRIDLRGDDAGTVREVAERSRLPVAVLADSDVLEELADVRDSIMILTSRDGGAFSCPGHVATVPICEPDALREECQDIRERGMAPMILAEGFRVDRGLGDDIMMTETVRGLALAGDGGLAAPIMADVTRGWDRGFADARSASMWEAESALAAMLAGADIIVTRGPGAADMARVYGEELADL